MTASLITVYFLKRKKPTFFNRLTMWATRSNITHALITFTEPITNKEVAVQSNGLGVHFIELKNVINKRIVIDKKTFAVNSEQIRKFLSRSYDLIGVTRYDLLGAIGIGLKARFGIYLSMLFDQDKSFSCAELVADLLEYSLSLDLGREGLISPAKLHKILSA